MSVRMPTVVVLKISKIFEYQLKNLEVRRLSKLLITGIATGHPELDKMTTGFT